LLTPAQRDRTQVVLVSPRNPLNIGAVARAMANFGFAHLTVVAPYAPHWREAKSAVGAPDLLAAAREFPTLREVLADCTFVAGTGTLTHRKPEQPVIPLPALASLLESELAGSGPIAPAPRIALVFGPEKHGLTRDDLAFCHALVEIPTDPRQPSMNLGQAVAVCLYELARPVPAAAPAAPHHPAPTSAQLDHLAGLIQQTMIAARYSPPAMQQANSHDLRLLLRRLSLSPHDLRRILGLFRRILWHIGRSGPARP
jgi:tRNA/rRNA methyltransferase